MKKIEKSVLINASKEKVWDVLTLDKYTADWYAVFSPGSHAVTDWKQGSKALFIDHTKSGMIAKVVESIPAKSLIIEYTGMIINGKEDYDSAESKKYSGGLETYHLYDDNGATKMDITSDMDEDMYEKMSNLWEKAFERVKELAETNH
jgi:hypothetical protein